VSREKRSSGGKIDNNYFRRGFDFYCIDSDHALQPEQRKRQNGDQTCAKRPARTLWR
jgi:hypothetical protein